MTGGIDLAAEWAGFHTIGFCEKEPYCQKVLNKHWPGVPIWEDIRDVTKESVRAKGIHSIDLISGGFPCQPFSNAGKRRGKDDDRFLWPEMLRVIDELRPRAIIGENVDGFVNMVQYEGLPPVDAEGNAVGEVGDIYNRVGRYILREAVEALEAIGYEVGPPLIIPACGVDAPHRRYRVFIVAHSQCAEWGESESTGYESNGKDAGWTKATGGVGASNENGGAGDVADTHEQGLEVGGSVGGGIQQEQSPSERGGQNVADTTRELPHRGGDTGQGWRSEFTDGGANVENPAVCNDRTKIKCNKTDRPHSGRPTGGVSGSGWRSTQPGLDRNFNGLSARLDQCRWPAGPTEPQHSWEPPRIAENIKNRKDRLKAIGNAVNPYQVFPVLYFMAQLLRAQKAGKVKDYSY